jgi:hypothetical protein
MSEKLPDYPNNNRLLGNISSPKGKPHKIGEINPVQSQLMKAENKKHHGKHTYNISTAIDF